MVSLQSIGLLTVLSNTIIQKHQSFGSQPSLRSNFQKQKLLRDGKNIYKNCTKKDLHDPDNHNGMITHLELGILECEVKWDLKSITTNKASGGDGIPVELFQTLKDDAVKVLHSMSANLENSAVATGLEKVSFHSNPKERQC